MGAVLPLDATNIDELEEGFVHKGRRLKGVPHPLARHIPAGNTSQFGLNKRRQFFEGPIIPVSPVLQQGCHVISLH
jgi:hypothetical protein